MKEGFDREIDSLLRRRARGTAESRLWGDGAGDGSTGAHLDADELGAFAEGALPAPARLAAASHLADCDRCRGVVVGLARAAGAGAEVKQHAVGATVAAGHASTPAWRALFASLFAPRVMRFAVPVLALSLVGVVSYVALRSKGGARLEAARNVQVQTAAPRPQQGAPVTEAAADSNTNTDGLIGQNAEAAPDEERAPRVPPAPYGGHGSAEVAQPVVADTARADAPSEAPPPPPPAAAPATEGPTELSKTALKPVTGEEADNKEKAENRDKSARASEPMDELAVNEVTVQQRRAAQSRVNQVQMPDGGDARNQRRAADNNASNVYNSGAAPPRESEDARGGSRPEAVGRARAVRKPEKKDDDESGRDAGDTRAAAGHRFRREGNAWVDVNYRPSMRSTGVRRGTEAFRALVADVPEVGRVAEAIGGEVIVVVGGHAYRIR